MTMWKWEIKQDNLVVVRGFADDKETALTEASHYANQYFDESFTRMIITIKELDK